ncbi:efflux RND transporter periplasmic adaptor subunit [Dongshaea marina]|uniref:efflux RND transporter periplasmic adaptor subunit n=1 Tax=Dongshaea marina TaxID=2047966 RepID=UPI00131EFF8A|nr:efflux RND transporter periplasmic adaptor subunit [Dongshaea marina]
MLQQDTRTAAAQVAEDQAKLNLAKADWQRQSTMLKKGLTSQSSYDDSYSSYQQARAVLAQDTALLSELSIKAPFAGIISITDYHVGDLLDSGSDIATLYDPDELTVTYQLSASERSVLKLGQTVSIQSESDAQNHASGTVIYISPNISTGLMTLKAKVTPGSTLKPGQNVKVVQKTSLLKDQVTIPTGSLLSNLEGMQAYVVENGKAVLREVKVGNYYDGYVQILSGLKAGEELVTNGQNFLHSDETVTVNNAAQQLAANNSAKGVNHG